MKIIKASAEVITHTLDLERVIELAGRTCYKSEDKITPESADAFIAKIKNFKHESVLEHGSITVRFVVDRGVSHELVRHRLASFSQESTRYCNYGKDKFGNEITVIQPYFWKVDGPAYTRWMWSCEQAETCYFDLLNKEGATPQEARCVLPNSLKTEVVMTANPREWRHVFAVRCHRDAHPQMREVMIPLHKEFADHWPALFGDCLNERNA
jgi:thymidylate synthase (FAD)